MIFYASKCHDRFSKRTFDLENVTDHLMLNPYYPATVGHKVSYMLDSGAFQDVGRQSRQTVENALARQLKFERTVGCNAEALVSYDHLVDEQYVDEHQVKQRVSEKDAEEYVEDTLKAAEYLASKRDELSPRSIVLSCQGSTDRQYLDCLEKVADYAVPGDIIGLGGFCILSRSKRYEAQFYDVIKDAFPYLESLGLNRVHIFGVGTFRALVQADIYARMHNIICSYDTSSAEINATMGREFNPLNGQLSNVYSKSQKGHGYNAAELAVFNIRMINEFWRMHSEVPLPDDFEPGFVSKK